MRGIPFQSSQGNDYFYDDDTGIIFPGSAGPEDRAPYEGKLACVPLGGRLPPPGRVDGETIRDYHLNEGYGFRHLILEVTEQCNLRCKYCVYSEHYPFNRGYRSVKMERPTAFAALDLFFENHRKVRRRNPTSRPFVGFYGGEPLMAFDTIRAAVQYFKEHYAAEFPETMFTITTNGMLLGDEVGDFLAENDFSVIVSLDGDKQSHDRNRIQPNGRGSFDAVFRNLQRFRERHPGYQRLGISACYDYRTDMNVLRSFFDAEKLFVVNISQIDAGNTTYYAQFTEDDKRCFLECYEAFHKIYAEAARQNTIAKDSFLFTYIGVSFAQFAFHPVTRERRPDFLPYTATCVPGEKLCVMPDGTIHTCERINGKFPIGTVHEGLDYDRIAKMVSAYNAAVCRKCAGCPVTRFCTRCFATAAADGIFQISDEMCEQTRLAVRESLVRYIDIAEFRPELLDDITIPYHREILERVGYFVE